MSPRFILTCLVRSHDCTSCTSGRMPTPVSWQSLFGAHSTRCNKGHLRGGIVPGRNKKKGHRLVAFLPDDVDLLVLFLFESESIGLANAIEHGLDRNCYSPVIQRGFVAGSALEPASDSRRCL